MAWVGEPQKNLAMDIFVIIETIDRISLSVSF